MPISARVSSSAQSSTTTATFLIFSRKPRGNFLMARSTSLSNSSRVIFRRLLEDLRTDAGAAAENSGSVSERCDAKRRTRSARTVAGRRGAADRSVSEGAAGVGGALRGPERKGPTGGWVERGPQQGAPHAGRALAHAVIAD